MTAKEARKASLQNGGDIKELQEQYLKVKDLIKSSTKEGKFETEVDTLHQTVCEFLKEDGYIVSYRNDILGEKIYAGNSLYKIKW